jgi:hypothetical protein
MSPLRTLPLRPQVSFYIAFTLPNVYTYFVPNQ